MKRTLLISTALALMTPTIAPAADMLRISRNGEMSIYDILHSPPEPATFRTVPYVETLALPPIVGRAEAQAPQVTQAPAPAPAQPQQESWLGWVLAAIAGIFTGNSILGNFKKDGKLDPNEKLEILNAVERLVQTGAPGRLVGMVPGVGSFEPAIRMATDRIIDSLQIRLASELNAQGGVQGIQQTALQRAPIGDILSTLIKRFDEIRVPQQGAQP